MSKVKEEDPRLGEEIMQTFSAPERFYSVDLGKKAGVIQRPMSTEKGRRGNCVVFKANYPRSMTYSF